MVFARTWSCSWLVSVRWRAGPGPVYRHLHAMLCLWVSCDCVEIVGALPAVVIAKGQKVYLQPCGLCPFRDAYFDLVIS